MGGRHRRSEPDGAPRPQDPHVRTRGGRTRSDPRKPRRAPVVRRPGDGHLGAPAGGGPAVRLAPPRGFPRPRSRPVRAREGRQRGGPRRGGGGGPRGSGAPALQPFVVDALTDLGAVVSPGGSLVWVQAPESVQHDLEVPANFALTFDPEKTREFEAELVAPGSYFLERLIAVVVRRGQWDAARYEVSGAEWIPAALRESGLGPETGVRSHVDAIEDGLLWLFAFRLTLLSDEKRESFHLIAVSPSESCAWAVDPSRPHRELIPHRSSGNFADLEAGDRPGGRFLRFSSGRRMGPFPPPGPGLLGEGVPPVFGYL